MALSLSVDALLGSAWLYHATSILWHAAASVMVTLAGEKLGLGRRAATLAGVLFAVHPATSLVADAIAFRSEAMITVALLGLVVAHLAQRPVLAACALLAGALSKETALVLGPLWVIVLELDRRARAQPTARAVLIGEALALAVAVALRWAFAPAWRAEHPALSASDAIGTRLASLARAAQTVLLPIDRTVCDASAIVSAASLPSIAGLAVAALVGWLAWRRRGAALLLALSLLPALQLVPVMRWWSPHYVYLPLACAAMLVAGVIDRSARPRAIVLAYAGAALLGVVTLVDGRRYADDEALWRPEVEARPACREGHFYLGEVARARQGWADAELHYRAALADWPGTLAYVDRAAAWQNLGAVELEQGDLAEARAAFARALELTSEPASRRRLLHNLAGIALQAGDAAEAWRLLEEEVARDDALPESIYLAAKALHALGREQETRALIARLRRAGWTGERPRDGVRR
jgi:tetratricopeptide (TPR) repeat protein